MPDPTRQPAELRERHNRTQSTEIAEYAVQGLVDWPNPRPQWREEVEASYKSYQGDVSSTVARQVDVAMVMRYFDLQELLARVFDEMIDLDSLLNTGDNGNVSSHPHISTFARLVTTSVRLANEIGATPMSRVKLGLNLAQGKMATAALQRAVNDVGADDVKMDVVDGEIVMSW